MVMMPMSTRNSPWHNADFRRLWMAQTISDVGSQISYLALPLVATVVLGASSLEMGLLTAAGALPSLLLGLHAGVAIDRRRKRPLMIASNLGRGMLVAIVPLAWLGGFLRFEVLLAVQVAVGILALVFQVAFSSFVAQMLARTHLLRGNSGLELSRSIAEVIGPGLAGWLISLLTAPFALLADAISYFCSALVLGRIRTPEAIPAAGERHISWLREMKDGIHATLGESRLRAALGAGSMLEFFNAMLEAVFVLFLVRDLDLAPGPIGVVFMIGSIGFVVGAILPDYLSARLGLGTMMTISMLLIGTSDLIVPFARGSTWTAAGFIMVAQFVFGIGLTIFKVNRTTLVQMLVADSLRGRVTATARTLTVALVPAGALAGGLLGAWVGIRETLIGAAFGEIAAAIWIWHSPLRTTSID